jgi:DNA ligase (NAD+)
VVAHSVHVFFKNNRDLLNRLIERGVDPEEPAPPESSTKVLDELSIVITGTLSKPRKEIAEHLESLGAKIVGSVSKKTSFVLAGENAGSKLAKARNFGVPVLDEDGMDLEIRTRGGRVS